MRVAIIGAGWAGLAAAVQAADAGHDVTVLEAARDLGGRARALTATLPDGTPVTLDNGQHILIGAYTETQRLMRRVGINPAQALRRLPLALRFPDGGGLALPRLPAPLDALAGLLFGARGWRWRDRAALLRAALGWRRGGFTCPPAQTVAQLCRSLPPRVMDELLEPLCVSALNLASAEASGQVFLRVLRDALFGVSGGSHLLLPRHDLGALWPEAAARWLRGRGHALQAGQRALTLARLPEGGWRIGHAVPPSPPGGTHTTGGQNNVSESIEVDRVVLACPPAEAARLAQAAGAASADWLTTARGLAFTAITTVYAHARAATLPAPLLALRSGAGGPAQFVFDRGQTGGPAGLLAFVVSNSHGEREALTRQVLRQAREQLGLRDLRPVQTVVEKRAAFACTPALRRPGARVADGLLACGDYVDGPYPATLEGAVRSGVAAARAL